MVGNRALFVIYLLYGRVEDWTDSCQLVWLLVLIQFNVIQFYTVKNILWNIIFELNKNKKSALYI